MYRRWIRPWWPARTLLALVLPFAGLLVFGAVSALAASNLVGNPGFESPFAGTQYEGTISPNFGNWIAYSFRHSIPLPSEVLAPSPVHGGSASGEIVNPAGVGSALFVQDIQSFDPNSTYTFSGWVYPVAGEQYFNLEFGWDRGSAGRTTGGSGINITPTATEFSAWQQSSSPAPALTYNAWHHIQFVVNSATLTSELYVDGACQGVSPAGQPVPGGSPSTILIGDGSAPSSESHFYWDDVELVSGVQVSGCPGGWATAEAEWLFDEGSGTTAADSSGNGHNGTLKGGVAWTPALTATALQFDGLTGFVEVPDSAELWPGSRSFTVSATIKTTSQADQWIIGHYACGGPCAPSPGPPGLWALEVDNGHLAMSTRNATAAPGVNGSPVTGKTNIADGQLHQVMGVRDMATREIRLYVDGTLDASAPLVAGANDGSIDNGAVPLGTNPVLIGARQGPYTEPPETNFFNGAIDDVRYYKAAVYPGGAPCAAQQPAICSITPDNGPSAGGTSVTVSGAGFAPGDELCFYSGSPSFAFQEGCSTSTAVSSSTTLTAMTPAASNPNLAGPRYLGIARCCSGLNIESFVSPVTFTYKADFIDCPNSHGTVPTSFPIVDVPVSIPGKPYEVEYGQLGLGWHAVAGQANASCALQSTQGGLPVYVTIPAGVFPFPHGQIGPIPAAVSVASARLDYFNEGSVQPPTCDWQRITHDCSLNGDGQLMVRWHTDGFDERDPVTNHSFYNSGPLTYYVNASNADVGSGLQALEVSIHKTLIAHLALVEKIAMIQEPPADIRVRDALGRVTGRLAGQRVNDAIPAAKYGRSGRVFGCRSRKPR